MPSEAPKPRRKRGPPPPAPPSWLRRHWALAACVIGAALVAALRYAPAEDASAAVPPVAPTAPPGLEFFSPFRAVPELPHPSGLADPRQQLVERFQLADHTYCDYLEGTRYPNESRPIGEHPDQVYPNRPVTESHEMHTGGGRSDPGVQVQTSQSRVFMASGEAVAFSLRALDADGKVLPLVVTSAVAHGITYQSTRPTQLVALAFADDGKGPDPVSGDGAFAAVLAPSRTGLAGFNGTIRTEVKFSAGERAGIAVFDVIYTPELPATWSGQVREAVEGGSLQFYLKAEVRQAGRYIVSGRVDDAQGRPFALATFNDLLNAGPNEVRLTVFGKLLRDQAPAFPLTLRDVEGYLLKENTDPDRALMPRLEGKVFVGKAHAAGGFADAEWQGEERIRHLVEFGKDLDAAKAALAEFDPAQPLPASECGAAPKQ